MDFSFTREQRDVLDRAEEMCSALRAKEEQAWHSGEINVDVQRAVRKARLHNFTLSSKYGGEGESFALYGAILERIGKEGLSPHNFLLAHDSAALALQNHGTEVQCFEHAKGVFASSIGEHNIRYEKSYGGFLLNGFGTMGNAIASDTLKVFADGENGRTAFIMKKDENCNAERMSNHGMRSADFGKIILKDCRVDKDAVIGEVGLGWKAEDSHKQFARLMSAAGYCGVGMDCASENKMKSAPVEAASLLTQRAFWLCEKAKENKNLHQQAVENALLAKKFAYKAAVGAAVRASKKSERAQRHLLDLVVGNYKI
ncbi:MAG TPA: acyl-CoA dehydrogenase family protein [archaeon]|nr:acyl-CoA dehydrogenase family protein [archaeon]